MVASLGPVDLGDESVDDLNQGPDDEDITLPSLRFEVAYTFADMRTQLYFGNQVADHLSFDLDPSLESQFGLRQEIAEFGTVNFAYAASSIPTDVWKDPYRVDTKRGDTERTSSGVHIAWDRIFTTPLEFSYSAREIELDDERSGRDGDLGLSADESRLLRRTGNLYRVDINYDWKINDKHTLEPGIGYVDADFDGDAMAQDGPVLQVRHIYTMDRWRIASKLYYQDLESDSRNPIYGKARQVETLGGSVAASYSKPFGLEHWTASAAASYYEGDSNIDFYDSSLALISVGMLYRFD
jgi:hypothetical protein